jgi:hypothetical protein
MAFGEQTDGRLQSFEKKKLKIEYWTNVCKRCRIFRVSFQGKKGWSCCDG